MKIAAIAAVIAVVVVAIIVAWPKAPEATAPPMPAMPAVDMATVPDEAVDKYCRVCYVDGGHKMGNYMPDRLKTEHGGKTYGFCSDACKEKFDKNPEKYVLKAASATKDAHEGHGH